MMMRSDKTFVISENGEEIVGQLFKLMCTQLISLTERVRSPQCDLCKPVRSVAVVVFSFAFLVWNCANNQCG
eukprot:6278327-Amphidinium_carterae.1